MAEALDEPDFRISRHLQVGPCRETVATGRLWREKGAVDLFSGVPVRVTVGVFDPFASRPNPLQDPPHPAIVCAIPRKQCAVSFRISASA
jgi:hypothetical protein